MGLRSFSSGGTGTGISSGQHGAGTDSLPTFAKPTRSAGSQPPMSALDKPTRRVRRDSFDSFDDAHLEKDARMLSSRDVNKALPLSPGDDHSSIEYDEKDFGSSAGGSSYTGSASRRESAPENVAVIAPPVPPQMQSKQGAHFVLKA